MEGGRRIYFLFRFDTGCQLIITIISSISSSNSWVFVLRLCVEKNALSSLRENHSNIFFLLFYYFSNIEQLASLTWTQMRTLKDFELLCNVKMIGEIIFNDNASIIFFNPDFYILRWNQLDTQLPPIMPGKFCYTCSCSTDDWNNFSLKKVQKNFKQIFFLWSCFVPSKHHTSEVMNDETWNLPSLISTHPKKNLWITKYRK